MLILSFVPLMVPDIKISELGLSTAEKCVMLRPMFGNGHRHISLKVPNTEFDFDVWFLTFGFALVH